MPVRTFTSSESDLLRRVKQAILRAEPSARLYLYGSRARGDAAADSDWDFLVLVDGSVDRSRTERLRDVIFDLELALDGCPVLSTMIYADDQWTTPLYQAMPFHESVEREGIEI